MSFLPLQGMHVVDVTTSFAGPYCTMLLGALGADVVKVEPLSGDEARAWGPPFAGENSALFVAANASKRSLALDLRKGRDVIERLVGRSDVFIQSLRPGLAAERGLAAEELRALNPRLVYCSISSFGRIGPWAERPGYDPLAQAAGGVMSVTGEPDRPGVRVGVSLIDQGTGMWAALGIVSALLEREHTGSGRVVDVSLYETALAYVSYHLTGHLAGGAVPGRHGTAFPSIAPYQTFACSDGEVMVAAANDRLFAALCEALDVSELAADSRFATNPDRVERREELAALLGQHFVTETRGTWLERLQQAGVPAAPVHDVAEVAEHEQTKALEILQQLDGAVTPSPSLSIDGERVRHRSAPPPLGAHTAEVLAEAGYSEEEIAVLVASGAARLGNRPRAVDPARQLLAQHALEPACNLEHRVEIDAGLDPFALEHVEQILRGNVAGCAGRKGAAAEPTHRSIENRRPAFKRCVCTRDRRVPRVVSVEADRLAQQHKPLDEAANLGRRGHADRVRENDLRGGGEALGQRCHSARVDPSLERAAESRRDGHCHRSLRGLEDPLHPPRRLLERRIGVPLVERLGRSHGAVDPVEASLRQPLVALLVEDEPGVLDAVALLDSGHDLLRPGHLRYPLGRDE